MSDLPEGLHLDEGGTTISDAQGHVWITIQPAAPGDPVGWRNKIVARVMSALEDDPNLALWFTPDAIRDHFEDGESSYAELVEAATDEQLRAVGDDALSSDYLYSARHEVLVDALVAHDELRIQASTARGIAMVAEPPENERRHTL